MTLHVRLLLPLLTLLGLLTAPGSPVPALPAAPAAPAAAAEFKTLVVDPNAGGSGYPIQLAWDPRSGGPVIAYFQAGTPRTVALAHPVGSGGNCGPLQNGSPTWQCDQTQVQTTHTSLALAFYYDRATDLWQRALVYIDTQTDALMVRYRTCQNGDCSGSTQTVNTPPAGSDGQVMMGFNVSAQYDTQGRLHLAYRTVNWNDPTDERLRYAVRVGSGGSGCGPNADVKWQCSTIATGHNMGFTLELTLQNDQPVIAYHDWQQSDLVVARPVPAGTGNCGPGAGGNWQCDRLAESGGTGFDVSITSTSSGRHISYIDITQSMLYYLPTGGPAQPVRSQSSLCSSQTQLRLDGAGQPAIAHCEEESGQESYLGLARPAAAAGSGVVGNCGPGSTWYCAIINAVANRDLGETLSMTTDPHGRLLLAYSDDPVGEDTAGGKVRYAYEVRPGDPPVTPVPAPPAPPPPKNYLPAVIR